MLIRINQDEKNKLKMKYSKTISFEYNKLNKEFVVITKEKREDLKEVFENSDSFALKYKIGRFVFAVNHLLKLNELKELADFYYEFYERKQLKRSLGGAQLDYEASGWMPAKNFR